MNDDAIPSEACGRLHTVPEVADRLRVSPQLVYQAIAERRLKCLRLSGSGRRGTIRIREADLQAFLAECEAQPEPNLDLE